MKIFSRARTNERAQRGVSELDGENLIKERSEDQEIDVEKRREEKRREVEEKCLLQEKMKR